MSRRKLAICVSTSKPSSSLTPGGGGGSIIMVCPHTGSILSSLRTTGDNTTKNILGMSSLSMFPDCYANVGKTPLMMAYGGTTKRDDTYGMLLSLRTVSSPPLLHWKCRLPEAQLSSGLSVSPCGYYVVGGGASGTVYVWSLLGGNLLRTVKAHYRAVSSMAWSDCGSYLVTGGADGMVHVYSLLDLVDRDTEEGQTVAPIRNWSVHHLPVTALHSMPSGRMVSASDDGQLVIMELFSEKVVATLQLPFAIHALQYHEGRLYAGAVQGSIYLLDLDVYAMYQTAQMGVTVVKRRAMGEKNHADRVLTAENSTSESYKTELRGHDKPITSLAILPTENDNDGANNKWLLVSGDDAGTLRVWDLESRGCIRVIRPWSHTVNATTTPNTEVDGKDGATGSSSTLHPVTSILVVPRGDDLEQQHDASLGSFSSMSKESKSKASIVSLVTPLKRFMDRESDDAKTLGTLAPFFQPRRDESTMAFWDTSSNLSTLPTSGNKRRLVAEPDTPITADELLGLDEADSDSETENKLHEQGEEILRLQKELEEAKTTIQRWENVNNKLMSKLKQSPT